MSRRSCSDSGAQTSARLFGGMLPARAGDHRVDVEFTPGAVVQRAKALIDLAAQPAQLLEILEEILAESVLLGFRKVGRCGERLFEQLVHAATLTRCGSRLNRSPRPKPRERGAQREREDRRRE